MIRFWNEFLIEMFGEIFVFKRKMKKVGGKANLEDFDCCFHERVEFCQNFV